MDIDTEIRNRCLFILKRQAKNKKKATNIVLISKDQNPDLYRYDSQNIHNTTVDRSISKLIQKLKQNDKKRKTINECIFDILAYVTDRPDDQKKIKIFFTCIGNMEVDISDEKESEADIIRIIWEKIIYDYKGKIELKNFLVDQIVDCFDIFEDETSDNHTSIVCAAGRIGRYIQTLEIAQKRTLIVPLWAIKDRIGHYCSRYLNKTMDSLSPRKRALCCSYDEFTERELKQLDKIKKCIIFNLERKFHKMYIKPGTLTVEELDNITKDYYDNLI